MDHFNRVVTAVPSFIELIASRKSKEPSIPWYPYGILHNLEHLQPVVTHEIDSLFSGDKRFADVGAADGDLSFFLESQGNECDIYDFPPTNYNTLRGARFLKDSFSSRVGIHEMDLDSYFEFDQSYDLIFFLGILYHLKNPFYVLEKFSKKARYMLLSTRIARHFNSKTQDVSQLSSAYLLAPDESNNDATNFWVFTDAGLRRILFRAGWDIVGFRSVGDVVASTPQDADRDERAFCALKSRAF